MRKIELISKEPLTFKSEDNGQAQIVENAVCSAEANYDPSGDNGLFVLIQSWDERDVEDRHPLVKKLQGKKVKVTIEILD